MATGFGVSLPLVLVIAGLVLSIGEAITPGAHLIVVGVSLLLAGLLGLVLPGVFGSAIALAGLVVVFGAVALFAYREFDFYGGKGTGRTSDSESLRGRTGRVVERVTESEGRVRLAGSGFNPHYAARTTWGEIAEGEEVVVVDPGGGNVLTVEAVDGQDDDLDRELDRGREATEESVEGS